MIKRSLAAFALLTIGLTVGMLLPINGANDRVDDSVLLANQTTANTLNSDRLGNLPAPVKDPSIKRIEQLEAALIKLEARLAGLENTNGDIEQTIDQPIMATTNTPDRPLPQALPALDALIAAGVDSFTAKDITDRQNALQLARLELRDNALRDGYLGTEQYREELKDIRRAETDIRNEVNDTAFDKYLFHTGQPNRVAVESVMAGSNAELSGIQAGDMILRYEDKPLYNVRDLRSATIDGEKNEIINVTVLRDGDQVTVSMPRGPLGVRLNAQRIDPEAS